MTTGADGDAAAAADGTGGSAGEEWSRAGWRRHLPAAADPGRAALMLGSQTISELAAETARRSPEKVAVVIDGQPMTHGELDEAAGRLAGWLGGRAGAGDRVLIAGRSSLEFVCAYLGILRAGAVAVLANPAYTTAEFRHLVADSGALLALADDEPAARLARLAVTGFAVVSLADAARAARLAAVRAPVPQPADVALLAYTSGTTGRPKGVPLTHRQLSVSIRVAMAAWRWHTDDALVHSLPLYHQHGLSGLHTALIAGSAAHIRSAFGAGELISHAAAVRASVLFAVPTMYRALLAQQPDGVAPLLGGLRLAVCGSAPLSPDLAERLPALLGTLPLVRYGTTESGLDISQPYGDSQPETVGVPLPGVLARVWTDAEESSGRDGEIQVRGPQVFTGYWRDSAATSSAFTADGWFRTGDIGAIDPVSGHMVIRGRMKELVITGGLNVYPREVELVLETHPAVAEAVVAGVPDERWGERVTAWVVRKPGSTLNADAVIAHSRTLLAPYKCPKQIIEIAEVPRSGLGKVLRQELPPPTRDSP